MKISVRTECTNGFHVEHVRWTGDGQANRQWLDGLKTDDGQTVQKIMNHSKKDVFPAEHIFLMYHIMYQFL